MDSMTQLLLGSAVGQATLGSKIGRKAILWGAICGTLPDLDVFIPFGGPVEDFTFHRGFSHAFLVHVLITPVMVWLILKIHPETRPYRNRWFWLVLLTLLTHASLDSLTVYGTQLFWPFTEYPVGISSLFIVDPFYTVPLLIGVIFALRSGNSSPKGHVMNTCGLVLSSLYLSWSLFAKWQIDEVVNQSLTDRNIRATVMQSTPAPFSTLLWRVVVMTANDHYYEGYVSVFDDASQVSLDQYPTQPELLTDIADEWGVKRLQWFTKGLYSVRQHGQTVVISDLRMGVEGSYVFAFDAGKITAEGVIPGDYSQRRSRPDLNQLALIWDRIWDSTVSLSPEARSHLQDLR